MAFRARGKEIINSIASVSTAKLPLYKKLWENPNPTSAFAAQTITLLSDDYDFLLWVGMYMINYPREIGAVISKKGDGAHFSYIAANNFRARSIERLSDTSFSIGAATTSVGGATASENNNMCIPLAVYGFKKEVDIQSVIASVSTDANKCMMSDGVTSVEQAIDKTKWRYLGQTIGNAEITIPAEAEEVICISGFSSTYMDFHFLTMMDDINVARKGYYASGTNNDVFLFRWMKATRKANMVSFNAAGTDYTASTITKWYVKG